ncbi:MAG TPA: hypothetical protein VFT74_10845 [Isosphaeraceae bacterium]|nr:hypothetical protein [Isosphaeraceae bacterium]
MAQTITSTDSASNDDVSFALELAAFLDELHAFEAERATWDEHAEKQAAFEAEQEAADLDREHANRACWGF